MNKVKALFPENVEKIIITKNDYDRLTGDLTLENIELKQEIERLNKENTILRQNSQYLVKQNDELEEVINKAIEYIEQHNDYFLLKREVKELLDILKGDDKK